MRKRYPSTQAMVTFLQVARAGSFSLTARELNLTHSAVSQQIRTLEDHVVSTSKCNNGSCCSHCCGLINRPCAADLPLRYGCGDWRDSEFVRVCCS